MKATKSELIRLARLAQKDISRGRLSKNAQQAVEVLADYQNPAMELLALTLKGATKDTKEQSDKSLLDSFGFLFGQSLESLRFDIESGYRTASELAEGIRKQLVIASRTKNHDPAVLLFLVQCFGTAKLGLGEELRSVVEHMLEELGEANGGDLNAADPADLFGLVADLVKQAEGDSFALRSLLAESCEGVPDEHRAVMATAFLFSEEPAAVEASIAWLLDPAPSVRQALANALEDAARKDKVTATMLRRMITMRNWLPENSRAALDAAIATSRRKGVSPAQWDKVEVRQLTCTGVDGSGAIGILAHCRDKRKNILGSLVLKQGIGVRDAWARGGMTTKEIDEAFFEASLMDQFVIPTDVIQNTVGHFLAVGHQTDSMPPFGLLQFLEAIGVSAVRPELISATSLLEMIQNGRTLSTSIIEEMLAEGSDLGDDYFFLDSWFEVGDEVDAVLIGNDVATKERAALVMERVLEPRREWWTQAAAWAAYILSQAGSDERWQEFYSAALAMTQKRALHEISLMRTVAKQTVMASETRQMAA
jgi:hypothetical protein